ncbi:YraN family protein [Candidatus Uhrbacteria bacterium]|nr:MAG: YraN family protein [Candidatus Uhrbacteria bacterium]
MTHARKADGRLGEDLAASFLVERGFRIVARNWTHRLGEIDLIAERGGDIRFVEVKYRNTLMFGHPEEAVTGKKLRHLARAIECWLEEQAAPPARYQADVLAITALSGRPVEYHWVENVYG